MIKKLIKCLKKNLCEEYEVEVVYRGKCMMCGKELTEGLLFCKECENKMMDENNKRKKELENQFNILVQNIIEAESE